MKYGTKDNPTVTYGGVEGRRVDLWTENGKNWMQLYTKDGKKNGPPQENAQLILK